MTTAKSKKLTDVCCDRFYEAYLSDEISFAYEEHTEIDETEMVYQRALAPLLLPFLRRFNKRPRIRCLIRPVSAGAPSTIHAEHRSSGSAILSLLP